MLETYRAVLNGDKLTWVDAPPQFTSPIEVRISLLTRQPKAERGQAMAIALSKVAKMNAFVDISDPVRWQRDIRQDRTLPL